MTTNTLIDMVLNTILMGSELCLGEIICAYSKYIQDPHIRIEREIQLFYFKNYIYNAEGKYKLFNDNGAYVSIFQKRL